MLSLDFCFESFLTMIFNCFSSNIDLTYSVKDHSNLWFFAVSFSDDVALTIGILVTIRGV